MQQVGRQHFATAAPVDRRTFPVPVRRPRRRLFAGLGHFWVLHRRLLRRGALVLLLAGLVATGYTLRNELRTGWLLAGDMLNGRVVEAGFGVAQIAISGQGLTQEADIVRLLEIDGFTSTLTYNAEAARRRLEALPSVEGASIRKIYPRSIEVSITEPTPVARWRMDGHTFLIDAAGNTLADASFDDGHLTLVIGDGAGDDAVVMINLMSRYPALTEDLAALSRIGDRRWDLIYYTGLRVQLPETGVVAALNRLNQYHNAHQLLDRDLDLIDMRVPQFVAVRQTEREENG